MQEIYAALLLHEAQKPIDESNVKRVLESVGITPDENKIKALVASLEGVNIEEAIKQAAVTTAPAAEEKKEEKKEEKPKEAAEGLSLLFSA